MNENSDSKGVRHYFAAIIVLSTDVGTVDVRLQQAFESCLRRIVPETDLPANLAERHRQLMLELEQLFADTDGVDPQRASRLAKEVVKVYERMTSGAAIEAA
jgi:hypothetical protein